MSLTPAERTEIRTVVDAAFSKKRGSERRVLTLDEASLFTDAWLVMYRSRAGYQGHTITCVDFLKTILAELRPDKRVEAQALIDDAPEPTS